MKKIYLLALAIGSIFSACTKKDRFPSNSAAVSFVNGCVGAGKIDAKVNAGAIQNAAGVDFQKASPYVYVLSGSSIDISYYLSGGLLLTSGKANLSYGVHYSAFAGGRVTSPFLVVTTDDLAAPSANSCKVRFVNLSPDTLHYDVALGPNTIAMDIASGNYSVFSSIVAGTYELKAGQPSNISSFLSGGTQTLAAGKIYTIILTGTQQSAGSSASPKLTLLTNN